MKTNKLFYTISIDEDCGNVTQFLETLMKTNFNPDNKFPLYLYKSEFIAMNETWEKKVLMVLHEPELYYKDNYKYFNEFRNLYFSPIKRYSNLGCGLLLRFMPEWERSVIKAYIKENPDFIIYEGPILE